MDAFLQTLINAITNGSLYALIALGYTMVYGILKFINFAHSDVFVLGAWITVTLTGFLVAAIGLVQGQVYWWLGPVVLLAAMTLCGLVGYLIERFAYRPLRRAPRLNVLITAMGVSLLMQNAGLLQFDLTPAIPSATVATVPASSIGAGSFKLDRDYEFRSDRRYTLVVETAGTAGQPGGTVERSVALPPGVTTTVPAGTEVPLAEPEPRAGSSAGSASSGAVTGGRLLAKPTLALPFGARPQPGPVLIDNRGLIPPRVLASGTMEARSRVAVKLEAPVTLEPGRDYTVRFRLPGASATTEAVVNTQGAARAVTTDELRLTPMPPRGQPVAFELVTEPRVQVTLAQLVVFANAIVLMVLLQLLVYRTKIGLAMRAVSYSTDSASLMGIDVNRVISVTFVIGAALAAAAGVLQTQLYSVQITASDVWVMLGLKAFVAAVVGGIGNIRGAVLGGFLIAFIEFFATKYVGSELTNLYVFAVLIVVLLVKPEGLLGKPTREKV